MKYPLAKIMVMAMLCLHLAAGVADGNEDQWDITTPSEHGIVNVIRAQLNAFKEGRFDLAYTHASDSIQSHFPDQRTFRVMVENGYGVLLNPLHVRFNGIDRRFKSALYRVDIISHDGQRWLALYSMIANGNGLWKIDDCRVFRLAGTFL
ncbi:MAG: DUF4864 domain-containing protein [Arenicellales bacterium]|jgi:hypothetical protein|nr:DUF4864 domain-containing protein [Arenicellales bacterium]